MMIIAAGSLARVVWTRRYGEGNGKVKLGSGRSPDYESDDDLDVGPGTLVIVVEYSDSDRGLPAGYYTVLYGDRLYWLNPPELEACSAPE